MNKKYILLIILVLVIFGCKKNSTEQHSLEQEFTVPKQASPDGPLDTALAEITVLSLKNDLVRIKIEDIIDYNRIPDANYSMLNTGDEIEVRIYSMLTSETNETGISTGDSRESQTPPEDIFKPTVGKRYLASMNLCISGYLEGLGCTYDGWSVALFNI